MKILSITCCSLMIVMGSHNKSTAARKQATPRPFVCHSKKAGDTSSICMAAPPGQANKRMAVDIHPIGLEELQQIRLPASVQRKVFQIALRVAKRLDKYEGKPTGCQLVLGCPSMKEIAKSMDDPEEPQSSLLGKLLKDSEIEGMLREEFSRDGGILIDGHSGEILATRSIFFPQKSDLVFAGHGTRHNYPVHVAASMECVIIVRSQDGYISVLSSEHLRKQECTPKCFRLNVEDEPRQKEILMRRTPLVRVKRDSTGSEKLVVPEEAAILRTLPPPIRVAGFVGPGRTGKSTLAGAVAHTKSLFPSAKTTKAVTEGIDAAAMKHPDGGSLILLDCEGFDNPLAPSRTEIVNLCSLVCGLIVSVDFDRLDDSQLSSLEQLSACREVLLSNAKGSALMPPPPDLLVVVNGSRFHDLYTDRTLEEALGYDEPGQTETGRHQTRAVIRKSFPNRKFLSVPCLKETNYDQSIVKLRREVHKCLRLTCDQQPFDGQMFLNLVHRAVDGINAAEPLHPGSVYDFVLREHFGKLIQQAHAEFKRELPADGPYQHHLVFQPEKLLEKLPEQCRKDAKEKMKYYFDVVELNNDRKGETIQNIECQERVIRGKPTCHEVPRPEAIIGGAAGGAGVAVITGGGAVLAAGATLTAPVVAPLFAVYAIGGAVTGGWTATTYKKYKRIVKCMKERRIVNQKVNGSHDYGKWEMVEEWTEEDFT